MSNLTLDQLMKAGVHFGHQTKRWNPKMRRYIFTARNGIYILDLQQTLDGYDKARKYLRELAASGGTILFVSTKPQAKELIEAKANEIGMPSVTERWLGGMMTNFETVKGSIARLRELTAMEEDGTFDALSKKEVTKLAKEKEKLDKNLGGIKEMAKLPDAIFIIDTKRERIALAEALRLNIPVIAIVDTNCDPEGISYVIPGNDDSVKGLDLLISGLIEAMKEGAEEIAIKRRADEEERSRKTADEAAIKVARDAHLAEKDDDADDDEDGE
jgi:small subunit ribosomal protein S2